MTVPQEHVFLELQILRKSVPHYNVNSHLNTSLSLKFHFYQHNGALYHQSMFIVSDLFRIAFQSQK